MTRNKISEIAVKYRKLAASMDETENRYNYERFADYIEENGYIFEDDYYETEEKLFEYFNEINTGDAEVNAQWNIMFPERYDDSITDFLSNKQ
ncbi:MAG: hypothetical protein LBQ01_05585 [Prevotellaceae bacterium]|nr:hypothetical protein [Prevotellaceae bacterium]